MLQGQGDLRHVESQLCRQTAGPTVADRLGHLRNAAHEILPLTAGRSLELYCAHQRHLATQGFRGTPARRNGFGEPSPDASRKARSPGVMSLEVDGGSVIPRVECSQDPFLSEDAQSAVAPRDDAVRNAGDDSRVELDASAGEVRRVPGQGLVGLLVLHQAGGERGDPSGGAEEGHKPGDEIARVLDGAPGLELVGCRPVGAGLADPAPVRLAVHEATIQLGIGKVDLSDRGRAQRLPDRLRGLSQQTARRRREVDAGTPRLLDELPGPTDVHRQRLFRVDVLPRGQRRLGHLVMALRVGQVEDDVDAVVRHEVPQGGVGRNPVAAGEGCHPLRVAIEHADQLELVAMVGQGVLVEVRDVAAAHVGDSHGALLLRRRAA